jgi:hypothetical protein
LEAEDVESDNKDAIEQRSSVLWFAQKVGKFQVEKAEGILQYDMSREVKGRLEEAIHSVEVNLRGQHCLECVYFITQLSADFMDLRCFRRRSPISSF